LSDEKAETARQRWLLIGEGSSLPKDVSEILKSEEGPAVELTAVISAEFLSQDPDFSLATIRTLLDNGIRVYYTPISLTNLLVDEEKVFEISGSTVREARGVNGRAILHEVKWVLTRKYLMVSGTVESMEFREPSEVRFRLRDKFGYRNVVLESGRRDEIVVGDSLKVIGLYFIGEGDFPVVEAVWTEKLDRGVFQASR